MRILYLCLLTFLVSCKNKQPAAIQRYDYQHYEGQIDGQPFYIDMNFNDTTVTAYWYTHSDEPIKELYCTTYHGDSLIFEIYIPDYADGSGDRSNWVKGKIFGNEFKGVYINEAGQKEFSGKEVQTIPELQVIHTMDTLFHPTTKKILTTSMFSTVYPTRKDDQWMNPFIFQLVGDSVFNGDIPSFVKKKQAEALTLENEEDVEFMQEHPYEFDHRVQVYYHHDHRLIVNSSSYQFLGGAHGSRAVQFMNIDTKSKKILTLSDILSSDQIAQLPSLLEKKLRLKFNLQDTDSLNTVLFDEHPVLVNNNFYATPKGIGFIYNQYEIAAYSYGIITLYLPFEEFKKE